MKGKHTNINHTRERPACCPDCKSNDIALEESPFVTRGGIRALKVCCKACGKRWSSTSDGVFRKLAPQARGRA